MSQVILLLTGLTYTLNGAALLLMPTWFFDNIGKFPPFNRHYEGDVGSFLLPIGMGLLFAARTPSRHVSLVGVAALGSAIHALNHVYDSLSAPLPAERWWSETVPLLIIAALLGWAFWNIRK